MWTVVLLTLASSLIINTLLFVIAFRAQSDKLTDISYALSFLTIDVISFVEAARYNAFNWIIFLLVAVWALRIGGFLLMRVLRVGKDQRFDSIRKNYVRFGKFWLGQAFTAWVLMIPATIAMYHGGKITPITILGLAIWLIGLLIESIADIQKSTFRKNKNNQGTWIESGIWKYSRHPNYFGEILVWSGVYAFSFVALNNVERLIGLTSPVLITYVLVFVSGVPLLEKSADQRWGKLDTYREYKKRTRLLIPLPK